MNNIMDKKEQLVATAFNLFYKYGIHAVGINRVLEESGIAKKTLYNHFSSKEDLIAATVEYCDQQYFSWLDLRLHEATPGRDALYAMLDAFDDLPFARAVNGRSFVKAVGNGGQARVEDEHVVARELPRHDVADRLDRCFCVLDADRRLSQSVCECSELQPHLAGP